MSEAVENMPFSPILIMEFVRQVTVNRFLNGATEAVEFKISNKYYEEMRAFPIQAQMIHLEVKYDEKSEILSVKADDVVLEHFRSQKSQMEIAGKYENQYAERYKQYIEIME